jgi:ATP-dependent RNA helicase DHX29
MSYRSIFYPSLTRPHYQDTTTTQAQKLQMAGGKKKKKPAANPARGFATTSIASKPKPEANEPELGPTSELPATAQNTQEDVAQITGAGVGASDAPPKNLSPEEFEKQLDISELQMLVDKHAQKSKRDAVRQKTRLETDRRVLRGQAETLNTRKWLPPELMEEILDLIKTEERFTGPVADSTIPVKPCSEEELTIRLWTLQQSLISAGFLESKVTSALEHVLKISDKIGSNYKDAIWGMEEALDWLARNCLRDDLPDYGNWNRKTGIPQKLQSGEKLQCPL